MLPCSGPWYLSSRHGWKRARVMVRRRRRGGARKRRADHVGVIMMTVRVMRSRRRVKGKRMWRGRRMSLISGKGMAVEG